MRKLLLLTGDIAAGKTAFSNILSKRYGIPVFQKDCIKEILGDTVGFSNREENRRLSRAATALMCHFFQRAAVAEGDMILESNFHHHELQELHRIAEECRYEVLTLVLRGDTETLYRRYMHRIRYENRHPVHLSTTIDVRDDFERCVELLRHESPIGSVIEINADSFAFQTDEQILRRIDQFIFGCRADEHTQKEERKRHMGQSRHISVAIDGPSGAGKSTLARAAAQELNFLYVDTGAIYRTVALQALRRGTDPKDAAAVASLLPELEIAMGYDASGQQRMRLNGEDVTDSIRTQEVSMTASAVAGHPAVRAFLLEMQRDMAGRHSVIMDGRDIGTVVLPGADVKIFLTASSEARARRRWLELQQRGTPREFDQLLRETRERDENDSNRAAAPLRPAEDAVTLDTTELDFRESLASMIQIIRERTGL